ncbi:hypothetical protein CROQUDRAFT_51183 [Cronartium quercuum f. sp. fusiforme G11]|uniref:Wax synthase domain-containing protein n=1 Tax=Cronartium quercuum f. sp. fusiforme G11 TaxID=708437 RepID=A0A9P6N8D7_9BASI|nr:hypothetical protein CROQUDRAFT_51183 [Cronartium quercuum f. sp. fusiforme G11]
MSLFGDPAADLNFEPHPNLISFCKAPPWSQLLILIPLTVQCALLHPLFRHIPLARWTRLILVAPNVHWCLAISWKYCYTPLELSAEKNMILSSVTLTLAMKTIEWGLVKGPYWSRASIVYNGRRQWDPSGAIQTHDLKAGPLEVGFWTFAQFTTVRGYQFSWGLKSQKYSKPTSQGEIFQRLLRSHFAFVLATAFLVWMRDNPKQTVRSVFGYGFSLLVEAIYTLAFGLTICCAMDMRYSALQLLSGSLLRIWPRAPRIVADYLDPTLHPPVFGNLVKVRSLTEFWGSAWHPLFRHSFIFCGGSPLAALAKRGGLSLPSQKWLRGLGVFAASGFLHEYALSVFARPPHRNPYVFPQSTSYLGPAFYFLVQPFGILLEQRFKSLKGPVWVWIFTLSTATALRSSYLSPGRLDASLPPLSSWGWTQWLVPMALHSSNQ